MPEIDQGIHPDFRPQIEAAAEALAAAYPHVEFAGIKLFDSPGDKSLGYAQDGWICLNAAWFAAPRAAFDEQVARSRSLIPANAPPWHGHIGELKGEVDRLMAHEFGHLLAQGLEGYQEFAREGHSAAIAYPSLAVAGYCLLAGEQPEAADEWWAETFAALRVGGSGSAQVAEMAAFLAERSY